MDVEVPFLPDAYDRKQKKFKKILIRTFICFLITVICGTILLATSHQQPISSLLIQGSHCSPKISNNAWDYYSFIKIIGSRKSDYENALSYFSQKDQQFFKQYEINPPKNDFIEIKFDCINYEIGKHYALVTLEEKHWETLKPIILSYFKLSTNDFVNGSLIIGTKNGITVTSNGVTNVTTELGTFMRGPVDRKIIMSNITMALLINETNIFDFATPYKKIVIDEIEMEKLIDNTISFIHSVAATNTTIVQRLKQKMEKI